MAVRDSANSGATWRTLACIAATGAKASGWTANWPSTARRSAVGGAHRTCQPHLRLVQLGCRVLTQQFQPAGRQLRQNDVAEGHGRDVESLLFESPTTWLASPLNWP